MRFFSVYSKLGAAKKALDEGKLWIDEVEDMDELSQRSFEELEDGVIDSELSDDSRDVSSNYSPILEFDTYDDEEEEEDAAVDEDSDGQDEVLAKVGFVLSNEELEAALE